MTRLSVSLSRAMPEIDGIENEPPVGRQVPALFSSFPAYWVPPTPEDMKLIHQAHRHHIHIFKVQDGSRHPWRMECACGEWQQANSVKLLWAHIAAFRHIKRGWAGER
jgi:hypothetical protein